MLNHSIRNSWKLAVNLKIVFIFSVCPTFYLIILVNHSLRLLFMHVSYIQFQKFHFHRLAIKRKKIMGLKDKYTLVHIF